jgi:hypothetical protein
MKRLCALCLVLAACAFVPPAAGRQVQWQWSESPSVRLGVRDKNDDLGGYEATFVVTAARTGKRYERTLRVEGDRFGSLNFPDDFAAFDWARHAPRFDWTCTVRGRVVVRGKFILATTHEIEDEEKRPARRGRRRA